MGLQLNTTHWKWPMDRTTIVNLSSSSLASSDRYEFAALTVHVPETSGRTIRCVHLLLGWEGANHWTAYNGIRWATKYNGGAWSADHDRTGTGVTAFYPQHRRILIDITGEFASALGASASIQIQAAIALTCIGDFMPQTVHNMTAELVVTYDFTDDVTANPRRAHTARFCLDSYIGGIPHTLTEVGTNQIPLLNNLPGGSKDFKGIWLDYYGNTSAYQFWSGDLTFSIGIDSNPTYDVTIHSNDGEKSCRRIIYDLTGLDTSTVHAVKMSQNAPVNLFYSARLELMTTYVYDAPTPGSGTSFVTLQIPAALLPGTVLVNSPTFKRAIRFYIPETSPVLFGPCGLFLNFSTPFGGSIAVKTAGQALARAYGTGPDHFNVGVHWGSHRVDAGAAQGGGITLHKGWNTVLVELGYGGTFETHGTNGMLVINYTCTTPIQGDAAKSKATYWTAFDATHNPTLGAASVPDSQPSSEAVPPVLPDGWAANCDPGYILGFTANLGGSNYGHHVALALEAFSGEGIPLPGGSTDPADYPVDVHYQNQGLIALWDGNAGNYSELHFEAPRNFFRDHDGGHGADPEVARGHTVMTVQNHEDQLTMIMNTHGQGYPGSSGLKPIEGAL